MRLLVYGVCCHKVFNHDTLRSVILLDEALHWLLKYELYRGDTIDKCNSDD